ncbi:DUF4279 domain-containing protein [Metabacillus litoralis]|uniref:DUF4279 domain-containing protein n=1 Tax=Metabacillus TaxID=2675233 RepID=UPI001E358287|nr:DUF4279 domain-containing protein [Metabacillus litoralis]UHA58787.1 DUF4279 domain-containing protein [Metabacillus litoralis]
MSNVMVYFQLYADDFPLDVITKRLGLKPTKSYKKGDIIKKIDGMTSHVRNYSSWQLSTGYQESFDVGELMEQVIGQIRERALIINELKREFSLECRFNIVIKIINGFTPGFHFGNDVIEFANSIKADFDVDLYSYPYDEEIN